MKDLSNYPGQLKICSYCSKKKKQNGLEKEHNYCTAIGKIVTESSDYAMTCYEFNGENLAFPNNKK